MCKKKKHVATSSNLKGLTWRLPAKANPQQMGGCTVTTAC